MYQTILLAVALQRWERYSSHALAAREVAAALTRDASKPLHVLSVYQYESLPSAASLDLSSDAIVRFREEETQRTDALMVQKMAEFVEPLVDAGVTVSKHLHVGNPRDVIPRVAGELQADVLIMGSHSKRGLVDVTLGGTAQSVSRHAPCTVVLVSPHR